MKAMILAAGLGTRLMPLTETTPKALVKFMGVPLLERIITNLFEAGIEGIIVNIHHYPDQIRQYLSEKENFGGKVKISDETGQLLDTGGGVINARWFLDEGEPFLVHNVDVLTNLSLQSLIKAHLSGDSLATVAVKKRPTSRSFLFDESMKLAGWRHNETGEEIIIRSGADHLNDFGNSCIQVINPQFFKLAGPVHPISLTDLYLQLAQENIIRGFVHNKDYWYDLGRIENFREAEEVFRSGNQELP